MAAGITADGAAETAAKLDQLGDQLAELPGGDKLAAELEATARGAAPIRTGRLAGTIRATVAGASVTLRAGAGLPYAGPIEGGWRAHNIEPAHFVRGALEMQQGGRAERTVDVAIQGLIHQLNI